MPVIGLVTGGVDFSYMKYVIRPGDPANEVPETAIMYGNFINVIIQFLIVAFVIFMVIKVINTLKRKEEIIQDAPAVPAGPTQEELLAEIRDLLKKQA